MALVKTSDLFLGAAQRAGGLGHIGLRAELIPSPLHPDALKLLAYWESKRTDKGLVSRAAIAPQEILPLLPSLFIAEPRAADWSYRLFGTGIAARCGVDFTNKTVAQVYDPETSEACHRLYRSIACRLQPTYVRGNYLGLGIEHATIEALNFPILGRDGRTIWIFGGIFFS